MSIINVNGTPIQPALDAAQPGDTLALKAGGYAGGLRISKNVTIDGAGGATIDGPGKTIEFSSPATLRGVKVSGATGLNSSCVSVVSEGVKLSDVAIENGAEGTFGIRLYRHGTLTLDRIDISHVGAALRVDSGGAGSVFTDVYAHDIDRMVVNSPTGNGGDAFQFVSSSRISLVRPRVVRARAYGSATSWQYDGGAFQFYNVCSDITIEDWYVENSVNVIETGKDAGAGDSFNVTLRRGRAVGNGGAQTSDKSKVCNGMLLRAARAFVIENNEFDKLDEWVLLFSASGQYAGGLGGNIFRLNAITLKDGASKAYVSYLADAAALRAAVTISDNRVIFGANTPVVADIGGAGKTRDLAQFKTLTGQGSGDTWGPIVTPVDPCASVKSELAQAQRDLATANSDLAANRVEVKRLQAIVDRVKADVA